MDGPLTGRSAFVTGGSKGIGRAICLGLARAGASVALTGREAGDGPGTAGATAALIEAEGGRALPLVCDVRDAASVQAAIDRTADAFGGLDILMSNAGLYFPGFDLIDIDIGQWNETIDTHIRGSFLCARFAARHMIAGGSGGSIIFMSSTAGDPAHDAMGNVAYAVAKAGVEQLARGLARELAVHDIAVNAIRPMALLSEGSRRNSDWLARYRERTGRGNVRANLSDADRMKQFDDPSAIVPAIVHLAQCRAGFTGHVVRRTDFTGEGFGALAG